MAPGLGKRLAPKVGQHFDINPLQTSGMVPAVSYFLIRRSVNITNVYRPRVSGKY